MKNVEFVPEVRISYNPLTDKEFILEPHTARPFINQQDQLNIANVGNPLLQGLSAKRNFGTYGYFEGIKAYDKTVRNNRKCTMKQVQRGMTIQV